MQPKRLHRTELHRRDALKSLLLPVSMAAAQPQTASGGAPAPQTSRPRLVAWMYMIYPLEQWLADYRRTFDAWEEGGVRGIAIGPLRFWDGTPTFDFTYRRAGAVIQTFAPDASTYRKHGVDPP